MLKDIKEHWPLLKDVKSRDKYHIYVYVQKIHRQTSLHDLSDIRQTNLIWQLLVSQKRQKKKSFDHFKWKS